MDATGLPILPRARRIVCDVPARLLIEGDDCEVRLRNISRDGARVDIRYAPAPGTAVQLAVGGRSLPALVHWSEPGVCGLRFLSRPDRSLMRMIESRDQPPLSPSSIM